MANLTAEQAAKIIKVSPATVRWYCRKGHLAGAYVQSKGARGKPWRIPMDSALNFERAKQGRPPRLLTNSR